MVISMVLELLRILMENGMKENGRIGKKMAKGFILMPMETSMLVIGRMVIFLDRELILLLMGTGMKVIGRMGYQMV